MPRLNQTPCDCSEPGYCHRHKMSKTRFLWLECQRNEGLFEMWERNADGAPAVPILPQPLPRCQHRGSNVLELVRCELCGAGVDLIPIYPCALHRRCSERRFGNSSALSRGTVACTTCHDYSPVEANVDPSTGLVPFQPAEQTT